MRTSFKTALAALILCAATAPAFAQGQIIIVNGNLPGVGFQRSDAGGADRRQPRHDPGRAAPQRVRARREHLERGAEPEGRHLRAGAVHAARHERAGLGRPDHVGASFPGAEYPDLVVSPGARQSPGGCGQRAARSDLPAQCRGHRESDDEITRVSRPGSPSTSASTTTKGGPPADIDLLAVVLHELGHGLGFATWSTSSTARSCWDRRHLLAVHARRHHQQDLERHDRCRARGLGDQHPQGVLERHQREEGRAECAAAGRAGCSCNSPGFSGAFLFGTAASVRRSRPTG